MNSNPLAPTPIYTDPFGGTYIKTQAEMITEYGEQAMDKFMRQMCDSYIKSLIRSKQVTIPRGNHSNPISSCHSGGTG